jgi:hypothetical protein
MAMALVFILAFLLVGFFHETHSSRPGRDERAPHVLRIEGRGDDGHGTGDSQALLKRLRLLELELELMHSKASPGKEDLHGKTAGDGDDTFTTGDET